jgi:hypothetical protein
MIKKSLDIDVVRKEGLAREKKSEKRIAASKAFIKAEHAKTKAQLEDGMMGAGLSIEQDLITKNMVKPRVAGEWQPVSDQDIKAAKDKLLAAHDEVVKAYNRNIDGETKASEEVA